MKSRAALPPQPPSLHQHLTGSFKAQWRRYRKRLKRSQAEFSEKAVHDLRVDIRRLLSAVELLSTFIHEGRIKKARKRLKQHLDTFDELRDTQVQLLAVAGLLGRFAEAQPFHEHLVEGEKRGSRKARKRLRQIKTLRLGRLIDHFREELRRRGRERLGERDFCTVLRAVDRAFAEVVWLRERVDAFDTDTIHRTRIAFKKFRYMVEALAPLLPGVTFARLVVMHDYQALMGDIQDAEVLLESYEAFLRKEPQAAKAGQRFRQELVRRRQALIRKYLAGADRLRGFWPVRGAATTKPAKKTKGTSP